MKNKIILLAVFCASCSSALPSVKPYHVDVQQGNVVDAKMMAQLRPGMSKSQVRYILGTPLLQDSFHQNRWDYFYQMRKDGQIIDQRRVIVEFENDQLKGVRGDVVPADSAGKDNTTAADTENAKTNEVAKEKKKGIFGGLKFWESNDDVKQPAKPVAEAKAAPPVAVNPEVLKPAEVIAVETEVPEVKQEIVLGSALAKDPTETQVAESRAEIKAAEAATPMANSPVPVMPLAPLVVAPLDDKPAPVVNPAPATESSAIVKSAPNKRTAKVKPGSTKAAVAAVPVIAETKPAEPEVENIADEKVAVVQQVSAWAEAWRKKDVKTYLAAYSEKFVPDDLPSRKAWVAQRKQRLSKPGTIGVELQNVNVDVADNIATVTFDQDYTSSNYSDHVGKTLKLVKTNQHWMIVKESVTANASRTATKDKAGAIHEPTVEPAVNTGPGIELSSPAQTETQEPVLIPAPESSTSAEPSTPSNGSTAESKSGSESPAKNAAEENDAQEKKPGLFERMLEKIGF